MTNWYNAFILLVPLSIVVSALFGEKTAASGKEKEQKNRWEQEDTRSVMQMQQHLNQQACISRKIGHQNNGTAECASQCK